MTNALAQNSESKIVSNILLENLNKKSTQKADNKNNENFSNIINNLDARTEKSKSNFIRSANNQENSQENKIATTKNAQKKPEKFDDSENNITNDTENNNSNELNKDETTSKEPIKNNLQPREDINKNTTVNNTDAEKNYLSDINNSSPVESSPVFSLDIKSEEINPEKNELEDSLKEINEIVDKIVSTLPNLTEFPSGNTEELKNEIESIVDSIDINDNIKNIIKEISNSLDNSDITKEQKENLLTLIDKFKKEIGKQQNTNDFSKITIELENLNTEIKNTLNKFNSNIEKLNNIDTNKKDENSIITTNIGNKEIDKNLVSYKENIDNLKENLDKINSLLENTTDESIGKIKEAIAPVKEILSDTKNLNISKKDIEILSENIDKLNKSIENLTQKIEIKDNNFKTDVIATENQKPTELLNFEALENVLAKNSNNLNPQDKKIIKEVVDFLNKLNENIPETELNQEIKQNIESLISKSKNNNLNKEEIKSTIENMPKVFQNELKDMFDNKIIQKESNQNAKQILNQNIKISTELNNYANQKNTTEEMQKEINLNKNLSQITEKLNFDEKTLDIKIKNTSTEKSATDKLNTEEKNIQKIIFNKEVMDDMIMEVDIKTLPSQSGALSSTDEVMKLGLGEQNSLNITTVAHGNISYDNMNSNSIIKNVAFQMNTSQKPNENPSMDEILNQISNKLTQLKNTSSQKLTMILRPNNLGRLSIELTSSNLGLSTNILAQNEDVRMYIEKNIDVLRQQLSDAGVNVNNIQIKTMGQDNTTTYDGNQNQTKDNQQENFNQQNNKNNQNENQNRKDLDETLKTISNYDIQFSKDFDTVLSKTLKYNINQ